MKRLLVLLACSAALAAPVQRYHYAGYNHFRRGELAGAGLTSDGRIIRMPALKMVADLNETYIWDACSLNGKLYIAAGEKAKIYEVNPANATVRLLTFFDEGTAYAIAPFQGKLVVGLSPSGTVVQIDPETGKHDPAATLKARYIWRMVPDDTHLWIATGMPGGLYRLDRSMAVRSIATDLDDHVEALAVSGTRLVAGTAPGGLVFESGKEGNPYLLADTPFTEIRDVLVSGNSVMVAGYNGTPGTPETGKDKPAQQVREPKPAVGGVMTIGADRVPDATATFSTMGAFCLAASGDDILVGTGHSGKLVSVRTDRSFTIRGEVDAGQIMRFVPMNGMVWFVTANPGRVFRMASDYELEGQYTAPPIMSPRPVQWGRIYLDADAPRGSRVELRVRVGNSATPDANWSPWRVVRSGEAPDLPDATGLQWQVRLISQDPQVTPEVTGVTVYARERNLPPDIKSVTLLPPGVWIDREASRPDASAVPVRAREALKSKPSDSSLKVGYRSGIQTVQVQADDPNKDQLRYQVTAVSPGGVRTRLIENGKQPVMSFHTGRLPEGRYRLEITVTDEPDNYPDTGKARRLSGPFVVDRTAPTVTGSPAGDTVKLTVSDNLSVIDTVRISRDGGKTWQRVWPDDGVPDSNREPYTIDRGNGDIIIQAMDDHGNMATRLLTAEGKLQ